MHRFPIRTTRLVAIAVCLAAAAAAGAYAQSSLPLNGTTINACRFPGGWLRAVDIPSDCHRFERALSWNIAGPQARRAPPARLVLPAQPELRGRRDHQAPPGPLGLRDRPARREPGSRRSTTSTACRVTAAREPST